MHAHVGTCRYCHAVCSGAPGASSVKSDSATSTPLSTPRLTADDVTGENHTDFVEKLFTFDFDAENASDDGDTVMENAVDSGVENSMSEMISMENSIQSANLAEAGNNVAGFENMNSNLPSRNSQFHNVEMMF